MDIIEPEAAGAARRRLLTFGLAGAAATLGPWLTGHAAASSSSSSTPGSGATTTTAAATTTTAPPRKPDADDIKVLGFLQSIELTIRDLFDVAINGKVFTDNDMLYDVVAIRETHSGYEQAISGFMGRTAPNSRIDAMYNTLKGKYTGKAADVASALATLENAAVATHTAALGEIASTDSAALIASILVVEARMATVLQDFAGKTKLDDRLADDGKAITTDTYAG